MSREGEEGAAGRELMPDCPIGTVTISRSATHGKIRKYVHFHCVRMNRKH
jgi:hypothetical protein